MLLTLAKLSAVGHRWLTALVMYDFTIQYLPKRQYAQEEVGEWTSIPPAGIKALCKWACIREGPVVPDRLVDQLRAPASAVPEAYACPVNLSVNILDQLSPKDMDPTIGPLKNANKSNKGLEQ